MRLEGRWAWWNQYAPQTSIEKCVQRAKDAKLDGVIIKYGYPGVESRFALAGIPWATERYVYIGQPEAEGQKLANAVDAGAMAAVINTEEGEGGWGPGINTGQAMERLITAFRARHPTVELYASVDTRGDRVTHAYQQVLMEQVAAILPMVYPKAFRATCPPGFVAAAFRDSIDGKDFAGIPILPTIQTYDGIGAQAVESQIAECKRRGLIGYQAYTIGHATDAEWAAFCPKEEVMPTLEELELKLAEEKKNREIADGWILAKMAYDKAAVLAALKAHAIDKKLHED